MHGLSNCDSSPRQQCWPSKVCEAKDKKLDAVAECNITSKQSINLAPRVDLPPAMNTAITNVSFVGKEYGVACVISRINVEQQPWKSGTLNRSIAPQSSLSYDDSMVCVFVHSDAMVLIFNDVRMQ